MEWARWQVVTTHGITYAGASENAGAPIISADSTDFGVPAANSTTPTVLWTATATATPWSDLAGWQQTAAFASNLDPGPAWMNRDTNQMIVDILIERGGGTNSGINVHEGARRQALDEGKVTRLNGVDIEIYNGTYVNDSGTVTTWIPTGIVAFAPPEAVRWIEGSQPVPTGNAQDLSDIVNGFGKQSWSIVEQDPVGVKVILSCPFFPAVEIPEALFIADVN